MVNGLPELPNATQQDRPLNFYVIDGEGDAPASNPVQLLLVQVQIPLEALMESGDDADQVIDSYMSTMRDDAVAQWRTYKPHTRAVENPVIAEMKKAIADHQREN